MASGAGISGNLEKSGNFVTLAKCHGKVREFREIWKCQGILTRNWEKSEKVYSRELNIAEVLCKNKL